KASAEVGIDSFRHHFDAAVSREEVLATIDQLNADPAVSGILCQLPVPDHLDADEITNRVDASKDVDGLTIASTGRLSLGTPGLRPCTPSGVMLLLEDVGTEIEGAQAVAFARSTLFAHPLPHLL